MIHHNKCNFELYVVERPYWPSGWVKFHPFLQQWDA